MPRDQEPPIIEHDEALPAVRAEERAPAAFVVPTVDERLGQMRGSDLADGAEEDPDEALFAAAFGDGEGAMDDGEMVDAIMRGEDPPAPRDRAARAEPVYVPPVDALQAVAAATGNGGALLIGNGPARDLRRQLGMKQVSELGGYQGQDRLGQSIRALGRKIFGRLPCFVRMSDASRAARQDPLGQVWVLTTMDPAETGAAAGRQALVAARPGAAGRTPAQARIDALLAWITTGGGGVLVDAALIGFPSMPGYAAEVMLYATRDDSYLVVREQPMRGAPVAHSYVYSWLGGMAVYDQGRNAVAPLERLAEPDEAGRVQITVRRADVAPIVRNPPAGIIAGPAAPAPAATAPAAGDGFERSAEMARAAGLRPPEQRGAPGPVAAVPEAAPMPMAAPAPQPRARRRAEPGLAAAEAAPAAAVAEPNPALPERGGKGRPGKAPAIAAAPRPNPMRVLRDAGFQPCGTPQGPALKLEDGDRKALVTGVGKSLALASSFLVRIVDSLGEVECERSVDDAHEAVEWASSALGMTAGPRR
jgi:hypothetical protein